METKESLLHQLSKTNPSNSPGVNAEARQYERDKVFLEALLDLRDAVAKLADKK